MILSPRLIVSLGLAAGIASAASAHEIKVFASRQALPDGGGKATVYLSWGHRVPVDDLVDAAPLERYDLVAPGGQTTPLKKEGASLQASSVTLTDAGVHAVVVTRKASVYTYVLDDEDGRQLRRGPKSEHAGARIESATRYQQAAKALIVVGKPDAAAPGPLGLPVEITPLDGPARWAAGADIRLQILLDGKPAPAAAVQARYVGFKPDEAWCYATESDRSGQFTVRPSHAGTWLIRVSVRKLAPGKTREEYDFELYTATLTLEVRP